LYFLKGIPASAIKGTHFLVRFPIEALTLDATISRDPASTADGRSAFILARPTLVPLHIVQDFGNDLSVRLPIRGDVASLELLVKRGILGGNEVHKCRACCHLEWGRGVGEGKEK
jgi:hypothetical protein